MNKLTVMLTLALLGTAFACLPLSGATLGTCQEFVNEQKYIDAGCCYKQFKEWGNCTLYLLKGARADEIKWNRGTGSSNGATARQYYYIEYWPSSGLGSDMGVCASMYGDENLIDNIKKYYTWMQQYVIDSQYNDDPPFDMDAFITAFENKLHSKTPEANCSMYYWFDSTSTECGQKEFCGLYMYQGLQTFSTLSECQAALAAARSVGTTATPAPSMTFAPATDNTGTLLVVALVLIAITAALFMQKKYALKKKAPKKERKHKSSRAK